MSESKVIATRNTKGLIPFKKGQSGNPGGRAKVISELRDLARAHTAEAIETLVRALNDKSGSVRIVAARELLDRGWGRAVQSYDVVGVDGTTPKEIIIKFIKPDPNPENV
jgi:hypothetical protein